MQAKHLDTQLQIIAEAGETTALLIEVLSIIQVGLLRGQFHGMSDLEGFKKAMDGLTLKHSALLNRMRDRINSEIAANPKPKCDQQESNPSPPT